MAGMMFIVTIPTEKEEHGQNETSGHLLFERLTENQSDENVKFSGESIMSHDLLGENTVAINISGPSIPLSHQMLANDEVETLAHKESVESDVKSTLKSKSTPNMMSVEQRPLKKSWEGLKHIVSATKKVKINDRKSNRDGFLNLPDDSTMECIMSELFKRLQIENAIWQLSKNANYYQITFSVESSYRHELILNVLSEWGIGLRNSSTLSMIPCAIYSQASSKDDSVDEEHQETEKLVNEKQSAWDRFMNSVQARWNVQQIVEKVKTDATLTFDFVTLVFIAGLLAAIGLIENDTTLLTSSMLISPLMGTLTATIFGIVIKDKSLIRFGLVNFLIGLSMATTIGFFFAIVVSSVDSKYAISVHGPESALTTEMKGRCDLHSLLVGMFTALPSGAAVAIAILGGNVGSLVGVAVSASLLPPAVNAGVLWALAILYKYHEHNEALYGTVITTNYYSNHQSLELAVYATISMLLTVVNIICILVMGVLILKIKEVAPITLRNRQLWKHDIKVARDYNTTYNSKSEEERQTQKLVDELCEMHPNDDLLRKMSSMSKSTENKFGSSNISKKNLNSSAADLEKFYQRLAVPRSQIEQWNRASSVTFTGDNWELPKYSSIFEPNAFSTDRRASMPFVLNSHSNLLNVFRNSELEGIADSNSSSPTAPLLRNDPDKISSKTSIFGESKSKKIPQFIVTPTESIGSLHDVKSKGNN